MVTDIEKFQKLCKGLTSRIPVKLGLQPMEKDAPEITGMINVLDDEMVEIALHMPQRKPLTLGEIAKRTGKDPAYLERKLQEMAECGFIEYNWENAAHEKQYYPPLFVPGIGELMLMQTKVSDEHPETADMFERMTFMPLEGLTEMVPPGGSGIGMHVIPVEQAIPAKNEAKNVEQLSYWLKKYEGHLGVAQCSCRRAETIRGVGSGDIPGEWCMAVGDFADYAAEAGFGRKITYEEAMEILKKAEDNGYVHQTTNIDGEGKVFAICNCAPGVCYALRTSQYFNTPNMSRSAYVARVESEKCVACGKCVEVCPAGAAKLGQKLCTKNGAVKYPKQELPDAVKWGPEKYNPNYKNDNRINCYDSGTAPCKTACPAHVAVQGYIKMAAQGRYLDALKLIKQDNPFPAVCGSICNRRCEEACTRATVDRALAIDEIKKFVAQQELKAEKRYIPEKITKCSPTTNYSDKPVAVIGAGPAGMSCAFFLAKMGYPVTVFEKNPVPGGMLMLGIPSFRLEKDVVSAEIEVLKEMGVEFRCGVDVGKDVTVAELREQGYKAFYLAVGAQMSSPIGIPGEELKGVFGGVDFLREVNLGKKPAIGKKVAVIGGGNVAMDVARTAVRLGAENVYIIYRRSEAEMPADKEEIREAREEGIQFCFLNAPAEIIPTAKTRKVSALRVELMELGEADEKGRRKPIGTGKFENIKVSSVIGAVGQRVDLGSIAPEAMTFNKNGTVIADAVTYQTAQSDIFVGGDCYSGPKFAIDAIAAGREGAESIHRYVHKGQLLTLARNLRRFKEFDKHNIILPASFDNAKRQTVAHDESKAMSFRDDRITFTEEQVKKEASRCLGCGATVVDENRCIGCGMCTVKCEFDAIHLHRERPECTNFIKAEDKLKGIAPYALKREIKILLNKKK